MNESNNTAGNIQSTYPQPTKLIWVTFDKVGYHRYPDAPDDVQYLKSEHRHKFKFKVTIEVFHDNRELEFHQFLNWLESLYAEEHLTLDYKSCEMIAEALAFSIHAKYGRNRYLEIEVAEDGECGCILKWPTAIKSVSFFHEPDVTFADPTPLTHPV